MKKAILSVIIIGSSLVCNSVYSQGQIKDSLGLPGDNFNLYAVLDVFQQCKTLEEFEGKINASDAKINNLDLNGDNKIDYIKVVDNGQGTMHAIVLKDEINEHEMQDVAVVEVDKVDGKIKIQIVGDEQLYGKNYIVEPKNQSAPVANTSTPNPGYSGPSGGTTVINNNYYSNDDYYRNNAYPDPYYGGRPVAYVPVDNWFMWDYLYAPTYSFYVSPWGWGYYPTYWNPWTPMYYHEYYGYHYQQYGYYERSYVYTAPAANAYYGNRRSVSTTVTQRTREHAYTNTYNHRELLSKTVTERRAAIQNNTNRQGNGNQNREPVRNNAPRENEKPRNENNMNGNQERKENTNENKPRNENTYKENPQKRENTNEIPQKNENRQQQNNPPRNENRTNNQEGNKSAPKQQQQTRSEHKAAKPAPKEEPRAKPTEGDRKK